MEKKYKYDLFLSFSSKDIDFVKPIWEKLINNGLNVFFFKESLKGEIGRYFDQAIENALEQSKDFLLICTPNAMKSEWVEAEYRTFFNEFYMKNRKERRLIILEGKGFDISSIPLMMRRLQIAKSIDVIIKILANKEGKGAKKNQLPVSEKPKRPSKAPNLSDVKFKKKKFFFTAISLLFFLIILIITASLLFKSKEPLKPTGKAEPGKVYVTNLTFMDIRNHTTMARIELGGWIDKAVVTGMNLGRKSNDNLIPNAVEHTIPNTYKNAETLVNITFNPNLSLLNKIDRITRELMITHNVDIIVTGQYIEESSNSVITIRPLLIIKNEYYIRYIPIQFKKSELFCQDPRSKKKVLCQMAFDKIAGAVKELLDELELPLKNLEFPK
jgi:hypothetical protein